MVSVSSGVCTPGSIRIVYSTMSETLRLSSTRKSTVRASLRSIVSSRAASLGVGCSGLR